MGYAQGDTIVHPQYGAVVIEAISTKDFGHGLIEYLELKVEFASLKILVPAAAVERVGIRPLSSREDAEVILSLLEEESHVPTQWTQRHACTVSRMKSHRLDQIAMVARDLMQHQRRIGKPLNRGEKKALGACLGILSRELALSLDMPEDETMALIAERGLSERVASGDMHDSASADDVR